MVVIMAKKDAEVEGLHRKQDQAHQRERDDVRLRFEPVRTRRPYAMYPKMRRSHNAHQVPTRIEERSLCQVRGFRLTFQISCMTWQGMKRLTGGTKWQQTAQFFEKRTMGEKLRLLIFAWYTHIRYGIWVSKVIAQGQAKEK